MKRIIAIVQDEDAGRLIRAMMKEGFGVTKLATTGGFLRAGNTTLLIGTEEEKLEGCMGIIERVCRSRRQTINSSLGTFDTTIPAAGGSHVEIMIGGATVFVLSVDEFKKF